MGELWFAMAEVTNTLCSTSTTRNSITVMACSCEGGWEYAFTPLYRTFCEDLSFLGYSSIQLINRTVMVVIIKNKEE